jgi:Adenylate and Guanylate cyclase catalytic domain
MMDSKVLIVSLLSKVMFADISGFTAWSSTREPELVFILLQTVFGAFDRIAKRRNVFKVETIGDCYVAVTGEYLIMRSIGSLLCELVSISLKNS